MVQAKQIQYTNREVDRLIEAGQRALKISERSGYYRMAEKIIRKMRRMVFFCIRTDLS